MDEKEAPDEINGLEIIHTWDKFVANAKKAGFREGAASGRQEVFQKSFDEGYIEGFRNGFAIGKYKGALRISNRNLQSCENDSRLQYSKRGWCQVCQNEKLFQGSTDDVVHIQTQFTNNLLQKLHTKYSSTSSVVLQSKLE